MELLVATRNHGKLREISALLTGCGIEVRGLADFPELPEIEEDGATFHDNARKKAATIARLSGRLTLADDSGLEVAALDGRPGVYSARFAGPEADDAANNRKLLQELAATPAAERQAAFVCVMALCTPAGECRFFTGRLPGYIVTTPRGTEGFGYDPLFWLPECDRTLAELDLAAKNRISHRGQALAAMTAWLKAQAAG